MELNKRVEKIEIRLDDIDITLGANLQFMKSYEETARSLVSALDENTLSKQRFKLIDLQFETIGINQGTSQIKFESIQTQFESIERRLQIITNIID